MDSYALKQALHGFRKLTQDDQGQRTTGRRDQGPEDHGTRGPEDQRTEMTKGAEEQRIGGRLRGPGPEDQRTGGPEDRRTGGPEGPGDPSHTF